MNHRQPANCLGNCLCHLCESLVNPQLERGDLPIDPDVTVVSVEMLAFLMSWRLKKPR